MFSLDIVDTDKFLDMPVSAQALYFHLGMRADDEGFVSSPRRVVGAVNASPDDMALLELKGYILPFASGVIVVRHWRDHNYIPKDRFHPTKCVEEKALLLCEKGRPYDLLVPGNNVVDVPYTSCIQPCIQNADGLSTEIRLDKSREDISLSETVAGSDVESKEDVPKGRRRPTYGPDSKYFRAAQWLADDIARQQPGCRKPTPAQLQDWANEFRLMEQRDSIAWELIRDTLKFARGDPFWAGNILSGGKLRKQYDALRARMEAPAKPAASAYGAPQSQREELPEYGV